MSAIDEAKTAVRERMWALLDERHAVEPPGCHGHIPSFVGAELAAERLAGLDVWRAARVIKVNPDSAQLPVRVRALQDSKLVYMAVPRLAEAKPFYQLDPSELALPVEEVASSRGAAQYARLVGPDEMQQVDLVVCGTVVVTRDGARLGKGAGYSDIEVGILVEAGLMGPGTTIASTVHSLQVVDEALPEAKHDFRVDVIVTPEEVVFCRALR